MNKTRFDDILKESAAEFVQGEIWTSSPVGNSFTRRWEIDRSDSTDAEQYLREHRNLVEDPAFGDGNTKSGLWRGGRVSARNEVDPRDQVEKWWIYQELREGFVTTVVSGGVVDWSEFVLLKQVGSSTKNSRPVLRLPNVDPESVQAISESILSSSLYADIAYRDDTLDEDWWRASVVPQGQEDGSHVIDVSFSKSVEDTTYIVIGRRESDFVSEETRLYKDIPDDQVTTLIESTVSAAGYILVDSSARKHSEDGIFDVYVTLRELKIPSAGANVLAGGTGGIFKTELHIIRGVLDDDLEDSVQALLDMNLVTNVRTTGGRSLGYWDVLYTILLVPATYIEYKAVKEFKEQASIYPTSWATATGLYKYLSDSYDPTVNNRVFVWETLTRHYVSPTAHTVVAGKKTRTISAVRTVSYSETDASTEVDRPDVGEIVRLSNGIYKSVSEVITHPWWTNS